MIITASSSNHLATLGAELLLYEFSESNETVAPFMPKFYNNIVWTKQFHMLSVYKVPPVMVIAYACNPDRVELTFFVRFYDETLKFEVVDPDSYIGVIAS
jgi:hypothetical protein